MHTRKVKSCIRGVFRSIPRSIIINFGDSSSPNEPGSPLEIPPDIDCRCVDDIEGPKPWQFFLSWKKEQMVKIQQRSVLHQICVLIFFYHGNRTYIAITCIWTLMASSEFSFDAILANIVGYWPNNPQTFPSFSPMETRHISLILTQFKNPY